MKRLNGFEGAHGNFKANEREAIADIISAAQYGHATRVLDGGCEDQSSFGIEATRLRDAILAAAAIIQKQKRK